MLTLSKNQLKAALSHAAKADIRYYLNSVLLEVCASGDMHIVATDGHRMFAGLIHAANVRWVDQPQKGPFSILVPTDAVKAAIKGRMPDVTLTALPDVTLTALPDGRYSLGDTLFAPVDGRFPDWRRIASLTEGKDAPAQYNWAYIADAEQALRDWHNSKILPFFKMRGDNAGLMLGPGSTAFCAVMPIRTDKCPHVDPFKPCAYEQQSKAA